jgi:hypothetical protein
MHRAILALALSCYLPMSANAACDAPEFRQFDFWIGDWEVVGGPGSPAEGQVQGHNRIEKVAAGCALSEHWRGAKGLDGRSLNAWDAQARRWRQFWIGGDGVLLQLEGGLQGKDMVLEGELRGASGGVQRQRIRWTPHEDGRVTQRWEASDDGGATWNVRFLGIYRPRTSP